MLSDHIKQEIFSVFQIGGCLLLNESSAESFCRSFLHYSHSAIRNHLSTKISMSPEWILNHFKMMHCVTDPKILALQPAKTQICLGIVKIEQTGGMHRLI